MRREPFAFWIYTDLCTCASGVVTLLICAPVHQVWSLLRFGCLECKKQWIASIDAALDLSAALGIEELDLASSSQVHDETCTRLCCMQAPPVPLGFKCSQPSKHDHRYFAFEPP